MELILLVGPPGSGKTTYYENNLKDHLRISQDDQGKVEHWKIFEKAIKNKTPNVVVDRVNHQKYQRERYLNLAKQNGYETVIIHLKVPYDICLKRMIVRKNHPTISNEITAKLALGNFFKNFEEISVAEADMIITIEHTNNN